MLEEILKNIGLKAREIKVYSELLKIGSQPASSLARVLKIPRTSTQFTAENLIQKGFLKKYIKNRTTYYSAENLQKIKKMLDYKADIYKKNLEEKKDQLDLLQKTLNKKQIEADKRSKVVFYEGVENVISSYMEFIHDIPNEATIYNYVSPATEEYGEFREGMKKFIKERINKKIKVKVICTYCEDGIRLQLSDKNSHRKTLLSFKKPKYDFLSIEILIYEDKVLVVSLMPNGAFSSLSLDNNSSKMQIAIFEMAWEQAKRDNQKIVKSKEFKALSKKLGLVTEY